MDAGLGGRDPLVRHRRCLRRRAQRALHRRLARPARNPTGSTLTTKVFNPVGGDPTDQGLAPDRIRRQVEGSLDRLGVDRIDLYLAHDPDPDDAARRHGRDLRASSSSEGVIAAWGLSNYDGAGIEEALRHGRPSLVAELLLAARPGRRGTGAPALPRARDRLRPVRPALGRLAHRPLPPRRGVPGGIADDDAAGALRSGSSTIACSTGSSGSPTTQRPAASRWPRSRSPGCSRAPASPAPSAGPSRAAHLAPVLASLDISLTAGGTRANRLVLRMSVRILSEADARRLLPMGECIEAMAEVLAALAREELYNPLRSIFFPPGERSGMGLMPAHRSGDRARLRAEDDLRRARQPRPRPRQPPGIRRPLRRRDRPGDDADQRERDHRDPHRRGVRRRDPPARAARVADARDPRRRHAGPVAPRGDAGGAADRACPCVEPNPRQRRLGARRATSRRWARSRRPFGAPTSSSPRPLRASRSSGASWLAEGTHINAVGSSITTTRELDTATIVALRPSSSTGASRPSTSPATISSRCARGRSGPSTSARELGELLIGAAEGQPVDLRADRVQVTRARRRGPRRGRARLPARRGRGRRRRGRALIPLDGDPPRPRHDRGPREAHPARASSRPTAPDARRSSSSSRRCSPSTRSRSAAPAMRCSRRRASSSRTAS